MDYRRFLEFDREIDLLIEGGGAEEAIPRLVQAYDRYPEQRHALEYAVLVCHRQLGRHEACLELLEAGLAQGRFYGLQWQAWDCLRGHPRFPSLFAKNEALKAEAQAAARPERELVLPAGYDPRRSYGLGLILHGDGGLCSARHMRETWRPEPFLERGYLVAYLQSSHVECLGGYGWTYDYGRSRAEIEAAYAEIAAERRIDPDRLIVGGFSGGSMASLNLAFAGRLPLRGLIALCPDAVEDDSPENVRRAAERGLRALLLEGSLSGVVPAQTELERKFAEAELPYRFIRTEGYGHAIPLEMDELLEQSLRFIEAG